MLSANVEAQMNMKEIAGTIIIIVINNKGLLLIIIALLLIIIVLLLCVNVRYKPL